MESYWKFCGEEESQKPKFLMESMNPNWNGISIGANQKPFMGGVWEGRGLEQCNRNFYSVLHLFHLLCSSLLRLEVLCSNLLALL